MKPKISSRDRYLQECEVPSILFLEEYEQILRTPGVLFLKKFDRILRILGVLFFTEFRGPLMFCSWWNLKDFEELWSFVLQKIL